MSILIDRRKASYRALELRRGVGATFSLDSLAAGRRAFGKGFRQSRTQGDPWQQGGVLVVGVDGRVRFTQKSASAGDHPDVSAVIEAVG